LLNMPSESRGRWAGWGAGASLARRFSAHYNPGACRQLELRVRSARQVPRPPRVSINLSQPSYASLRSTQYASQPTLQQSRTPITPPRILHPHPHTCTSAHPMVSYRPRLRLSRSPSRVHNAHPQRVAHVRVHVYLTHAVARVHADGERKQGGSALPVLLHKGKAGAATRTGLCPTLLSALRKCRCWWQLLVAELLVALRRCRHPARNACHAVPARSACT